MTGHVIVNTCKMTIPIIIVPVQMAGIVSGTYESVIPFKEKLLSLSVPSENNCNTRFVR